MFYKINKKILFYKKINNNVKNKKKRKMNGDIF